MAVYLKIAYFLFFIYSLTQSQTTVDYCLYPCGSSIHTVCERKNVSCGKGTMCGTNYKPIPLNDTDRRTMLDIHNSLRNKVATGQELLGLQPSASNMNALSYSKELESIAQCHTNACVFAHDKCRRTVTFSWVGQNLGLREYYGSTGDYKNVMNLTINSWYNEVKDFSNVWTTSFGNYNTTKVVGHYTQVVWAKSSQVGCSITCHTGSDGWIQYILACNYATGGNVVGQSVYNLGLPASACGTQAVNTRFPGLCGPDNIL